ncbi:MAG: thioesterase family protein [Nitrososphaerota archaeon]|nr:acyl-CoA thioesterase [Nitrososphaerales archaeon]MDW8044951.1 thioesterase family protein [Nitrososphaerota archaeon]
MNECEITMRVTWFDVGGTRVATFPSYFKWFYQGFVEYLRNLGIRILDDTELTVDGERTNVGFRVVEAYCRYKEGAKLDELITVTPRLKELSEKSLNIGFTIHEKQSGRLLAEGYLLLITVDRLTVKPVNIPQSIANRLKKYLQG